MVVHHMSNSCSSLVIFLVLCFNQSYGVIIERYVHGKHGRESHDQSNGCDFFQGSWVYDQNTITPYNSSICPFILQQFDCQGNKRSDKLHLKYKWKPKSCELPRFDGEDLLKRLKGKKIMFVGDSLSLNMWQSLTCMLHIAIPNSNFVIQRKSEVSIFTFLDYNVSILFSRNAFLIDLVSEEIGRVLKLDSIENGNSWKGFDMLIFNTWHWWLHKGRKQVWDYIQEGNKIYRDMDRLVAFEKGITTWSKWVDSNINPNITQVFFQGISPTHYDDGEWKMSINGTCNGQTQPIHGSLYPGGPHPSVFVMKEVLRKMSKPVTLLDITTLSQMRIDGHPSSYGSNGGKGNDCSHWCLPGVPDTWNQLLYAILVSKWRPKNIL
ncbi:protein trichome birefringence-like 41 [Impatiens glandulifera]|uniref:protein trichome birefringence-like 41 n=1 Tax=Impatiens glandulifera TaxID=253017 RepID=UPI001FB06AA7|nr:protein trichome birefringence-like 41 [Impatiens glandulifera]